MRTAPTKNIHTRTRAHTSVPGFWNLQKAETFADYLARELRENEHPDEDKRSEEESGESEERK